MRHIKIMAVIVCLIGLTVTSARAADALSVLIVVDPARSDGLPTQWKVESFYKSLWGQLLRCRLERDIKDEDLPINCRWFDDTLAVSLKLGTARSITVALCQTKDGVVTVLRSVGPFDPYGDLTETEAQCDTLVTDAAKLLKVGYPVLGINTSTLDAVPASQLEKEEIHQTTGLYITRVEEDGLAAQAGLRRSDVIVQLDDCVVQSSAGIRDYLRTKRFGSTLIVSYYRDNERKQVVIHL